MLQSIAADMGTPITVDNQTPGGYTFENHYNDNNTINKIFSQDWDYVILQAQSQEPSFPDAQVNAGTLRYADSLAQKVYENNPCTQVLFFMTWGRENGDPQWGPISTYEGMQSRLRNAYLRFADTAQASVAPVGMAWKYVRDNYPSIDLYSSDGSHPSVAGTYVAACTFYTSIFRTSVDATNFISSLNSSDAESIQEAADVATLDSLSVFYLRPQNMKLDFSVMNSGNQISITNNSWHVNTYNFDFGDGNTSTLTNPIHTYANSPTNYVITLTGTNTCDTLILVKDLNPTASLPLYQTQNYHLQYGLNSIHLENLEGVQNICIYNLMGKVIYEYHGNSTQVTIDLKNFETGVYILNVNGTTHKFNY